MIDLDRLAVAPVMRKPYVWAELRVPFDGHGVDLLPAEFPTEGYRSVEGSDGEKSWRYYAKSLWSMDGQASSNGGLSATWVRLVEQVASPSLRKVVGRMGDVDLDDAVVEVNALVYPGGGDLGPHTDLVDKLATIILYFNPVDHVPVGGRFLVLGSRDVADVTRRIDPIFGNGVLVVRSDRSWHAVEEVSPWSRASRRAVTVTFYRRGSRSTMWPNGNDGDLAIRI